jgi:hypothetical protein
MLLHLPADALPRLVPETVAPIDAETYLAMYIARQRHLTMAYPTGAILKAQLREVEYQLAPGFMPTQGADSRGDRGRREVRRPRGRIFPGLSSGL